MIKIGVSALNKIGLLILIFTFALFLIILNRLCVTTEFLENKKYHKTNSK